MILISAFKMIVPLTTLFLALAASNGACAELKDIENLARASNELAIKMHKSFNADGNVFFCPASISIALGMLYRGARGVTAEEMRQTLSYDTAGLEDQNLNQNFQKLLSLIAQPSDEYKLDIANAIVSQIGYSVSAEYKEILNKYYGAILKELDFVNDNANAIREINDWVSTKTGGKIPKLLESLDPATVLVLLNAVYFKGTWEKEFSTRKTKNETFYNDGLDPVTVEMMNDKKRVLYREEKGFKALKLAYKGGDISMVLLLPNQNTGLNKLEKELTTSKLDSIVSGMENISVQIGIPKFKLEYSKDLKETLSDLGMKNAFGNGANFNGISEKGGLKVSKIIHKAVVEVNEEGSEAAGATGIGIVAISLPLPPKYVFRADHPFLFFIRDDRTGMILFFGRVNKL